MSSEKIEKILKNTKTSMEMEGFVIEPELEEAGRKILTGELDINVYIADYIAQFKQKRALANEI
ncbi:MAG: hypothetical protein FWH05_06540 [Oscillospiraceae bacterium]|nr:hypothetical protein [Oscillospiraceae bacterium]